MFIIAPEQTRELDSLQRLLGQTWPALPSICDQSGNRFGLTDRVVLRPLFIPKRPSIKIGKPFFFNDLAVPELWECWTLGITTYLFDGEERRANVILREDIL